MEGSHSWPGDPISVSKYRVCLSESLFSHSGRVFSFFCSIHLPENFMVALFLHR